MSSRTRYRLALALAATVVAITCVCGGVLWADHQCRQDGGHTTSVGRSFVCVSDDGRLIYP